MVIGGTAASYFFNLEEKVHVVGEIKQGLPGPTLPRMDLFRTVWMRSIPLAIGTQCFLISSITPIKLRCVIQNIVGYTITLSVGKLFGQKHGYKVDPNQVSNTLAIN